MRYVITGGCGFIGSHVVQLLKSKGKKVAIIDKITNRIDRSKALLQNVQHFYMDISDPELMERLFTRRHCDPPCSTITC